MCISLYPKRQSTRKWKKKKKSTFFFSSSSVYVYALCTHGCHIKRKLIEKMKTYFYCNKIKSYYFNFSRKKRDISIFLLAFYTFSFSLSQFVPVFFWKIKYINYINQEEKRFILLMVYVLHKSIYLFACFHKLTEWNQLIA